MPKKASDAPKVYVTRTGGFYVKADELLRSKKARERLREMSKLAARMKAAASKAEQEV